MAIPATAELQRWSQEVARDPAAPAFLPLARAYRRQGHRQAALGVCLRALQRQPLHVEGHALLALLYLEAGERQKAVDAWSAVLRLEPSHFEAHRGMGFHALEQRDLARAARHLERAAALRPGDPAVQDALELLRRLETRGAPAAREPAPREPDAVFRALHAERAFRGALVFDAQGLVLAGSLTDDGKAGRAEALGAVLGGVVEEALRALGHLSLGDWQGILLETPEATLHLARLDGARVILIAAAPQTPTGWLLHTAARAAGLAREYLEVRP